MPSQMDVTPWCYKCSDLIGYLAPGVVRYRAPYSAKSLELISKQSD